jgi:hypothetical protein
VWGRESRGREREPLTRWSKWMAGKLVVRVKRGGRWARRVLSIGRRPVGR